MRLALLAIVFWGAMLGPSLALDPPGNVVQTDPTKGPLAVAIREAKASLPQFLEIAVDETGASIDLAAIKVVFDVPNEAGKTESIWVGPFSSRDGKAWIGNLGNTPQKLPGLEFNDLVEFDVSQIQDWSGLGRDGVFYGHFTLRAIRSELSDEVGAWADENLSADPLPSDWSLLAR